MLTIYWLGVIPKTIVQEGSESLAGSVFPGSLFDYASDHGIEFIQVPDLISYLGIVFSRYRPRRSRFFVFHLQGWHFFPILLSFFWPVCFYYQNCWPSRMGVFKRLVFFVILKLVDTIVVQDSLCYAYFSKFFSGKKLSLLPWFVDGRFFASCSSFDLAPSHRLADLIGKKFVFVPGDRARDGQLLLDISNAFPACYVRVSRSFADSEINLLASCPDIKLLSFVSYSDLLWLYSHCSLVLNLVDDSLNSAGMTVLFESLATNTPVITPSGHCSSGYVSKEDSAYIRLIDDFANAESWVREIEHLSALPRYRSINSLEVRKIFEQRLSEKRVFDSWKKLFSC